MGATTTAPHAANGNGSNASGEVDNKPARTPRRARAKTEGKRVSFVIPDEAHAKLEAAAKKDFRDADNLAMVATLKYIGGLEA